MTYISLSIDLANILNTISWICIILLLMAWADTMGNHILFVGQCDLYFMVQWF